MFSRSIRLIIFTAVWLAVISICQGQNSTSDVRLPDAGLPVSPVACGKTNCSNNVCLDSGRSCCWCERADYGPLQVCQCCPRGYYCCPYVPSPFGSSASSAPQCCPLGSSCGRRGCTLTQVVRPIPSTTVCSQCDPMYLSITADNTLNKLYLDGVLYTVPNFAAWTVVDTILIPADTRVIAVQCSDSGVVAGLLASVTNNYLLTDTTWKCTRNAASNFSDPAYDDSAWPNAVVSGLHSSSEIHGLLPPISTSAVWIWTQNFIGSSADTPVYCRAHFPTDTCNKTYGRSCSNLCELQQKVCCQCEMMQTGPSKVCSCCPAGSFCCKPFPPSSTATSPVCCPIGSQCSLDGTSCTTVSIARPTPAEIDCGPCNN